MSRPRPLLALAAVALSATAAAAVDLDRPPLRYTDTPADDPVSRLQKRLAAGAAKLSHADDHGYLRAVLKELSVPESSQVLVFSKTSLQRGRITPKTPRAVYFNDDVYVGFCLRGDVLELSAADPKLGTVFYTLDQEPAGRPRFERQGERCLICHASNSFHHGLPGHLVRSVHPDRGGEPVGGSGSYRTDPSTPFENRWGGWYVTGRLGGLEHLGNRVFRNRGDLDTPPNPAEGASVTDLAPFFTVANYPTPHSDVVALMVLEHQVLVHNKLARAALETRMALHDAAEMNKALKEKPDHQWESTGRRIRSVGEELVRALLFSEEAALPGPVAGTSGFAAEFAARGPSDPAGRSLRQFDLTTRLFKHPCSYLVYSEAFDALPAAVKDYVWKRLHEVLTGADRSKPFAHLSPADRREILAILRATKPGLPGYWRE